MNKLSMIVATDINGLIGCNGKLPWHIPWDLKYFKQKTYGANVVMGRKTYESIGKPLHGRKNIILTNDINYVANGCIVKHSVDEAIDYVKSSELKTFIIGGLTIYNKFIDYADEIFLNEIQHEFVGDTHFPEIDPDTWKCFEEYSAETTENETTYKIKVKYLRKIKHKNMYK